MAQIYKKKLVPLRIYQEKITFAKQKQDYYMKYLKIFIWIITIPIVSAILFNEIIIEYYSYAKEIKPKLSIKPSLDTLTIIIIGDSWAAYHSNYNPHLKKMLETLVGTNVQVLSNGYVGAKTKTVYLCMHDSISQWGTKCLLDRSPDYCIISTGINDAVAKIGIRNYCYHYNLIIKHLLSANIKPIVLDMPDVDYKKIFKQETLIANIRHFISSVITNAPIWDFGEYRRSLQETLHQYIKRGEIIYIPSSNWNEKGFSDSRGIYLDDHIHLNKKGYQILDSCIVSHIYNDMHSTPDFQ